MAALTVGLAYSALPPAGAPAEVVPAYASPLEGLAVASLPCPLTSHHAAPFFAVCRAPTLPATLRLSSLVRRSSRAKRTSGSTGTEMSGRDLGSQRPRHRLIDLT